MVTHRKRRFRLVAGPFAGRPRRRAVWQIEYDGVEHHAAVEVLTEAEFSQRTAAERKHCQHVPGVGYVAFDWVSADEAEDIDAERREAVQAWELARGLDECRW